jgi:uncharacterized delta-60 repeat protein
MKRLVLLSGLFLWGGREPVLAQTWARTYGGNQVEIAYSVRTTPDGGFIVAGFTDSFGSGGADAWVLRLDGDGNLLWQKAFGGSGTDGAYAVRPLPDGGFVVVGYTYSFTAGGESRAWVFRLSPTGSLVWQKAYGPGVAYGLDLTPDGGFVVVGATTAFGAAGLDTWVLRLDAQGDVVWQKRYGGGGSDVGYSIRTTFDGGFVVAGFTTSFGAGSYDAWVLRLDAVGNVLWQRAYGGGLQDWANSVDLTTDGGFVVAGYTERTTSGSSGWTDRVPSSGRPPMGVRRTITLTPCRPCPTGIWSSLALRRPLGLCIWETSGSCGSDPMVESCGRNGTAGSAMTGPTPFRPCPTGVWSSLACLSRSTP